MPVYSKALKPEMQMVVGPAGLDKKMSHHDTTFLTAVDGLSQL